LFFVFVLVWFKSHSQHYFSLFNSCSCIAQTPLSTLSFVLSYSCSCTVCTKMLRLIDFSHKIKYIQTMSTFPCESYQVGQIAKL